MAVAVEQPARRRTIAAVSDWVFTAPVWLLTLSALVGATVVHGYHYSTALGEVARMASDPFTQLPDVSPWAYQSPLWAMIPWAVGVNDGHAVALVSYVTTFVCVGVSVAAVHRWVSAYAARLFVLAYFCSPQSWAGTAYLGAFDIITVAGLTVCAVGPAWACFAAGLTLGFDHFEQGGIALVAIAVIRLVMRRESHVPMVAAFVGLAAGKALLLYYQVANGIDTDGRTQFLRDTGLADLVGGWRGHETVLVWAVYNVLWVAVIWMLATMRREDRALTILLHVLLTLPVLITYDLSRVYRTVTWPIVMLLVLYAADWPDRRLVQRAALLLAIAAIFVPRTEIWYGGKIIN